MAKRLVPILLGALILTGVLLSSKLRSEPLKVSGFLETHEIRLGSRVGGRVAEVRAREGDRVKAGQVLVVLEPYDLLASEARARAELDARKADLARLTAGYRPQEIARAEARVAELAAAHERLVNGPRKAEVESARAQVEVAEARQTLAERTYERTRKLVESRTVPQEELDRAVEELQAAKGAYVSRLRELQILEEGSRKEDIASAKARLDEARAALELAVAGYREEEIEAARAGVAAAVASVDVIEARKQELRIAAPTDGSIESLDLEPGDLVGPGSPVMSMTEAGRLWVRAYLPENLALEIGQRVRVTVDAYPEDFTGEVTYVSPQAEFAPSNVQTPEERSKQVFRIKVTLLDGLDRLRAGMSADVWLESKESDE
jgi:multidrug resistance efflux pump